MPIAVALAAPGSPPASVNMTVATNATWDVAFAWTREGAPVNLAAMQFRIDLRAQEGASDVAMTIATNNSRILFPDRAGGVWQISVPADVAKDVPAGTYVYDVLTWLDSDPRVWRHQKGAITVEQGVTAKT